MSDPTVVTGEQVYAAWTALGIVDDVNDIVKTVIDPRSITITRHRRNADGKKFVAGDEVATTVTTIGINWKKSGHG